MGRVRVLEAALGEDRPGRGPGIWGCPPAAHPGLHKHPCGPAPGPLLARAGRRCTPSSCRGPRCLPPSSTRRRRWVGEGEGVQAALRLASPCPATQQQRPPPCPRRCRCRRRRLHCARLQIAARPSPHQQYFVLLILTDGCAAGGWEVRLAVPAAAEAGELPWRFAASHARPRPADLCLTRSAIMDQAATLRALVAASQLPLSLLIVGVGNEDFQAMEVGVGVGVRTGRRRGLVCMPAGQAGPGKGRPHAASGQPDAFTDADRTSPPPSPHPPQVLDGDRQRIRSPEGQAAARDTVQFVPLRPTQRETVESLAAKLLAELPGQVRWWAGSGSGWVGERHCEGRPGCSPRSPFLGSPQPHPAGTGRRVLPRHSAHAARRFGGTSAGCRGGARLPPGVSHSGRGLRKPPS